MTPLDPAVRIRLERAFAALQSRLPGPVALVVRCGGRCGRQLAEVVRTPEGLVWNRRAPRGRSSLVWAEHRWPDLWAAVRKLRDPALDLLEQPGGVDRFHVWCERHGPVVFERAEIVRASRSSEKVLIARQQSVVL